MIKYISNIIRKENKADEGEGKDERDVAGHYWNRQWRRNRKRWWLEKEVKRGVEAYAKKKTEGWDDEA